jgi:hypothetical protein
VNNKQQVTAFFAHSFDKKDKDLVGYFDCIFSEIGINVHSADSTWPGTRVPVKIRNMIDNTECFIALITKRDRIQGKKLGWGTSTYVISEIGYAVSRNKPIVIYKEKDVECQTIAGDIEYVEFERGKIYKYNEKIKQCLNNLFSLINDPSVPPKTTKSQQEKPYTNYPYVANFESFGNQFLAVDRLRSAINNSQKLNVIVLSGHSILATPGSPLYLLLRDKARTGSFQMNVAIMSNASSNLNNLSQRARQINESTGDLLKKIEHGIEGYIALRDKYGVSLNIRSYEIPLFWRYFGLDSEIFLSYYFGEVHSLYQKLIAFNKSNVFFDIFEKFFESFWAGCKPLA